MTIRHISDTALWVAYYRAVEDDRPDRAFSDPYARRLAGPEGAAIAQALRHGAGIAWVMAIRTVALDELLKVTIGLGARRVVNLACGYDSRPWRLTFPADIEWVDVDLPALISDKTAKLADVAPNCRYRAMTADLTRVDEREAVFASIEDVVPTVVLTEGLLVYLDREEVAALARRIYDVSNIRWWLVDTISPQVLRRLQRAWGSALGEGQAALKFAPAEGLSFFQPFGWVEGSFRSLGEVARRIGRLPWRVRLVHLISTLFMSSKRRRAMTRLTGFARLDRTLPL